MENLTPVSLVKNRRKSNDVEEVAVPVRLSEEVKTQMKDSNVILKTEIKNLECVPEFNEIEGRRIPILRPFQIFRRSFAKRTWK